MNNLNRLETNLNRETPFATACVQYCRKLFGEVQRTKNQLVAQFLNAFAGEEQILRLAVNEAEAIAFRTHYPHLLFPSLAMERVEAAAQRRTYRRQSEGHQQLA